MPDSENLLKELLETFRLEARDHLGALSSLLVSLENESGQTERGRLLESIFRRMHTLKGAAHAVNLLDVAESCQLLESLLAELKRGERLLELGLFDRLHGDVDALSRQIFPAGEAEPQLKVNAGPMSTAEPVAGEPTGCAPLPSPPEEATASAIPAAGAPAPGDAPELRLAASSPTPAEAAATAEQLEAERRLELDRRNSPAETVRVPTRILEALLVQAEELVLAKLSAAVLVEEVCELSRQLAAREGERVRGVDLSRELLRKPQQLPEAARLATLLQQGCEAERQAAERLQFLEKGAAKHLRSLRATADPLLEDIRKLHLLPFSSLTDPFAKLVRDLGRELGKQAELSLAGVETEVDRRILAELKEPLLHLLRNVMDHGIENPADRRQAGKPERGRIGIAVRLQDANRAELVVSDDGRGIDLGKVKGAALRLELTTPEAIERMPDAEALQLIFESGISTSPLITTLSGRGVGLAIVRESLERLGGHVTVASRRGEGSAFHLTLPLSYAMMRGLLVETGGRACIVPAANVELTARVAADGIRSVENRETVLLGGEVVSLVKLSRLLELGERPSEDPSAPQPVVLVEAAERKIAFAVDQVVGVQEFLVKPLGSQLSRVRNVSGATVLGDGRVVPILNLGDLFRSALLSAAPGAVPESARRTKRLSVLVAEDSITSRTLLKNILQSSGFLVQTAIDGADALSQLKVGEFDLLISDVEMPRMDGFQLTATIRADQRLQALPVILVTGLESRSDRERGIEVGANAYVVKSSFDQGGLLDVIQKLT